MLILALLLRINDIYPSIAPSIKGISKQLKISRETLNKYKHRAPLNKYKKLLRDEEILESKHNELDRVIKEMLKTN